MEGIGFEPYLLPFLRVLLSYMCELCFVDIKKKFQTSIGHKTLVAGHNYIGVNLRIHRAHLYTNEPKSI